MLPITFNPAETKPMLSGAEILTNIMNIPKTIADKYQNFFNFMNQEHDLILTIDEMNEIVSEVEKLKDKLIEDEEDYLTQKDIENTERNEIKESVILSFFNA